MRSFNWLPRSCVVLTPSTKLTASMMFDLPATAMVSGAGLAVPPRRAAPEPLGPMMAVKVLKGPTTWRPPHDLKLSITRLTMWPGMLARAALRPAARMFPAKRDCPITHDTPPTSPGGGTRSRAPETI